MKQPSFAHQLIGARQGLHELAKRGYADQAQFGVVDIDVSPVTDPTPLNNLDEAYGLYETLAEDLPADEQDHDVLAQQIAADSLFVRSLKGEEIDFGEYISGTVGIMPELASDKELQAQAREVDELLQQQGIRHDHASIGQFEEKLLITNPAAVKHAFLAGHAVTKRVVGNYVPLPSEAVELQFKYVSNVPYSAYFTTGANKQLVIGINAHPQRRHTLAKLGSLDLHEYGGHAVQMALRRAEITGRRVSPAAGVTAIHSPENTQLEVVAQAMEYFLPDMLPAEQRWLAEFQLKYNELKTTVQHNAHLMAADASSEAEIADVVGFAMDRLPLESPERLRSDITKGHKDPTMRAGLAVYLPTLKLARSVIDLPPQLRQETLSKLYVQPMTPAQMHDLITQAKNAATLSK